MERESLQLQRTSLSDEPTEDDQINNKSLFSPAYVNHETEMKDENAQYIEVQQQIVVAAPQHTTMVTSTANATVTAPAVEMEDPFDPFIFIKNLPIPPPCTNFCMPEKSTSAPRVTLALDLDETLVHCSVQPLENAELTFTVSFNQLDYQVYVRTRPYLLHFLQTVSQWFEVIIFTASQKVYADKLLDILDPQRQYIKHRVFREACVCVQGNYLKDLSVLGRPLNQCIIVDNSIQAFGFQLDNGIPIQSFFCDAEDTELLKLIPFLRVLKDMEDVRPVIRKTFKLTEIVHGAAARRMAAAIMPIDCQQNNGNVAVDHHHEIDPAVTIDCGPDVAAVDSTSCKAEHNVSESVSNAQFNDGHTVTSVDAA